MKKRRSFPLWGLGILGLLLVVGQGCMSMSPRKVVKSRYAMPLPPPSPAASGWVRSTGRAYDAQRAAIAAPLPQGIKEADIVRLRGNTLFYLHTRRGLLLVGVKDPKNPIVQASLPIYGTPVEMFVEGKEVFVLLNDALVLRQRGSKFHFVRDSTAQLARIDISNVRRPRLVSLVDIPGRLREGVARKQGNTIFVVTKNAKGSNPKRPKQRGGHAQLALLAYDVSGKRNIQLAQRHNLLPAQIHTQRKLFGSNVRASYLKRFVITATPDVLMIATSWRIRAYTRYGRYRRLRERQQATRVDVLDLRQVPDGPRLRKLGRFWLEGHVLDQFKQSFYWEGTRGVYLGVTLQNQWLRRGRRSWRKTANVFHTVALSHHSAPRHLSRLAFGKRYESVRGSVFDIRRRVLYAITALEKPPHVIIDPLYAIDFKTPERPKVLSQINDLSGDMNLFQFIEGRRFLLAVGRDTSNGCKGFGRSVGRSRAAISIIDVRNLRRIRLVQRKCFSFPRVKNILSTTNRDRDQAHKMIGLASDGDTHFVTVPLFFRRKLRTRQGRTKAVQQSAIGLMQWDLRRYNPRRSKTHKHVLANRGMVLHPSGKVRRTMLFKRGKERYLLNLSRDHISVAQVHDAGAPQRVASLDLSPTSRQLLVHRGYSIQHRNSFSKRSTMLLLRNRRTKKETKFRVARLLRFVPWKEGLLLFLKGVPGDNPTRNVRYTPQTMTRYLALSPNKGPILHKPRRWELKHMPPALATHCQSRTRPCRRGVRIGHHTNHITVKQGLVWIARGQYKMFGMNFVGQRLIWMREAGQRLEQRVSAIPVSSPVSLVKADDAHFFLRKTPRNNMGIGAIQHWTLGAQGWKKSPWRPTPGDLQLAFPAKNKEAHQLVYHKVNHRLMLLRWHRTTHTFVLVDKHQSGELASLLRVGSKLILTSTNRHRSYLRILRLTPQGLRLAFFEGRFPPHTWIASTTPEQIHIQLHKGSLGINIATANRPKLVGFWPGGQRSQQVAR